jgi:hypothetical protein
VGGGGLLGFYGIEKLNHVCMGAHSNAALSPLPTHHPPFSFSLKMDYSDIPPPPSFSPAWYQPHAAFPSLHNCYI